MLLYSRKREREVAYSFSEGTGFRTDKLELKCGHSVT